MVFDWGEDLVLWLEEQAAWIVSWFIGNLLWIVDLAVKSVLWVWNNTISQLLLDYIIYPLANAILYVDSLLAVHVMPGVVALVDHVPWIQYQTIYAAFVFYRSIESTLVIMRIVKHVTSLIGYIRRVFLSL